MEETLKKIFADLFGMGVSEVDDNLSIDSHKSWDSLRQMQIIVSIEENFGLEPLSVDEIVEMTSFKRIKEILKEKVGGDS